MPPKKSVCIAKHAIEVTHIGNFFLNFDRQEYPHDNNKKTFGFSYLPACQNYLDKKNYL